MRDGVRIHKKTGREREKREKKEEETKAIFLHSAADLSATFAS